MSHDSQIRDSPRRIAAAARGLPVSDTAPAGHGLQRPAPPTTVRWAVGTIAADLYLGVITLMVPAIPSSAPAGFGLGAPGSGLLVAVIMILATAIGFGVPAWIAWLAYRGSRAAAVLAVVCFAAACYTLLAGFDVLILLRGLLWAAAFVLLVLPESRRYSRRVRDLPRPDRTRLRGVRL